jgi:hypothetical protein
MLRIVNWLKTNVFWHVTPCSLFQIYQRCGGTYWLRFQMTPNMEEASYTEKLVCFYQTTRCHIPEDNIRVIAVRTVLAFFASHSVRNVIVHVSK